MKWRICQPIGQACQAESYTSTTEGGNKMIYTLTQKIQMVYYKVVEVLECVRIWIKGFNNSYVREYYSYNIYIPLNIYPCCMKKAECLNLLVNLSKQSFLISPLKDKNLVGYFKFVLKERGLKSVKEMLDQELMVIDKVAKLQPDMGHEKPSDETLKKIRNFVREFDKKYFVNK